MATRIIEPKRHTEGYLYHHCPKIGDNIQAPDCLKCSYHKKTEQLNTRYRLHCDFPIEGPELRVFEPPRAHDRVASFQGDGVLDSPVHTVMEPKLDGVRGICHLTPDAIIFTSRRKNKSGEYKQFQMNVPHLVYSLVPLAKKGYTILDGEIVVPVEDDTLAITMGVVGSLPERAIAHQEEHGYAYFSIFDVVQWQGTDVSKLPLWERKAILQMISTDEVIRVTPSGSPKHRRKVAHKILKMGYEGVVLKDPNAGYFDSRAWLKWKESITVDAIVMGWEWGKAGGRYANTLGALKVGVIDDDTGEYRQVARVIPGTDSVRDEWFAKVKDLTDDDVIEMNEIIEMEAQTWTKDGRMRHPRVIGYRNDKSEPNTMNFNTSKYPELV